MKLEFLFRMSRRPDWIALGTNFRHTLLTAAMVCASAPCAFPPGGVKTGPFILAELCICSSIDKGGRGSGLRAVI